MTQSTFSSLDRVLASKPTRNQLCMLLAGLLSREAIIRALLDEATDQVESAASSSAERETP